jgi:hypothetical protein
MQGYGAAFLKPYTPLGSGHAKLPLAGKEVPVPVPKPPARDEATPWQQDDWEAGVAGQNTKTHVHVWIMMDLIGAADAEMVYCDLTSGAVTTDAFLAKMFN